MINVGPPLQFLIVQACAKPAETIWETRDVIKYNVWLKIKNCCLFRIKWQLTTFRSLNRFSVLCWWQEWMQGRKAIKAIKHVNRVKISQNKYTNQLTVQYIFYYKLLSEKLTHGTVSLPAWEKSLQIIQ